MAPKSLALAALLIVVVSAEQVPRAAGLGASPSTANVSFIVSGIVPCATGSSIAPAPAFANALLQLVCGSNVVGSTTTDITGAFRFSQSGVSRDLTAAILGDLCKVVVVTPLVACDKSLAGATGTLSAQLKLLDITGTGSGGGLGGLIGGIVGVIVQSVLGGDLSLGTLPFSLV